MKRKTLNALTTGLLFLLVGTMSVFAAGQQESAGDDEVFEFTYMARYFGDRTPDMDFPGYAAIEEATNTRLDIDWLPAGEAYQEGFRVRLAARNLPMAAGVYTVGLVKSPMILNAVDQDAFWPAGDYVLDHPEDFPSLSGLSDLSIWELLEIDGQNWFLIQERPVGRPVWMYRADVAQEKGFTERPETSEEVYELWAALAEEFEMGAALWEVQLPAHQWAWTNIMATWFGAPNNYGIDDNGNLVYAPMTEGWKEMMRFVKRLYDDGIINSDFPAISDVPTREMFHSGRAGSIRLAAGNYKAMPERNVALEDPTLDHFDMFGAINVEQGGGISIGSGAAAIHLFNRDGIESEAQLAEALEVFEFVNTPENYEVTLGEEGVHYETYERDGVTYMRSLQPEPERMATGHALGQAFSMSLNEVVNNPAKYGQPARDIPQLTYDMRQRGVDYGVRDLTFGMSSETYNELSPQLDDIVIDATTRFIFGEITEDEYDAEMQRWLDSGGADVLAEYQAQYDG